MQMTKKLSYLAVAAVLIFLPAVGFSDAGLSEGERLGKTCAGCHGTGGNTPGEYIGKIGGQNAEYLTAVLQDFGSGKRPMSVEMSIVAKGYTPEQLASIAEYYAAQPWVNSDGEADAKLAAKGEMIAAENGCMDCHGERGEGMDAYPRVGGQNKGYLTEVLKRYRDGGIVSDEMSVVEGMTDEQFEALASYMTGLR